MTNEISIRVTGEGASAVRTVQQVRREGEAAGKAIGTSLTKGAKDAETAVSQTMKKAAAATKRVGQAGKDAGQELAEGVERGAQQAKDAVDEVGDQAEKSASRFDAAWSRAEGLAGPAGAAIGGALMASVVTAIEHERIDVLLRNQVRPQQAAAAGALAGQLWASGFSESLEEAADASAALFQAGIVNEKMAIEDLRAIGEEAIATARITGERVQDIGRAVSQMLRTGMVRDARQGFALISQAQQLGLNKSEDLVDTLNEYSTQFRKLGLEGPQALGLISQAMEAGARDSDIAADSLKEFSIRAVDGSALTAKAFEDLGLDVQATVARIAAGGPTAASALNDVLIKLRQVKDPAERARLAVALFGTQAEDLGDALFEMDLSSAALEMGDYADATRRAAEEMANADGARLQEALRKIESAAVKVGDAMAGATDISADWAGTLTGLEVNSEDLRTAQYEQAAATEEQAAAAEETTGAFQAQATALGDLIDKNSEFYGIQRGAVEAEIAYQEAIDAGTSALKTNGATLDTNTEKGRANMTALLELAESTEELTGAMADQGASASELNAAHDRGRASIIALATQMGLSEGAAIKLANQLLGMAKPYKASFAVDASAAYSALFGLERELINATRPRSVKVNVNYRTGASNAALAHGGVVGAPVPSAAEGMPHRAAGGPTGGPTAVHERGFEIIDLAPGSRVNTHADSERMLLEAARGGAAMAGGGGRNYMEFLGNVDTAFASAFLGLVRKGAIKLVVGGQRVQVA
ncbi:phage tail tape measure protein [Actinokineospora sp. UTMC 2448]|uniref:phage tail tape measure protein n=1 Tax=Actinokineospora sp. UTMC 2448 TaxID=2268449 RepID=UPI0021647C8D|nr:phage tail tape measure protein [Actinokineospora sp. UTMC 2448]UVS81850.1 Phage-related minor tail protein [Actinokineospora sp. UTMC 2448]